MKKQAIVGAVVALGLFAGSTAFAATCGSCGDNVKCKDTQAVQQFKNETAGLFADLKAKNIELRNEYGFEGINMNRVNELEGQIKELKAKIHAVADKLEIPVCCTV